MPGRNNFRKIACGRLSADGSSHVLQERKRLERQSTTFSESDVSWMQLWAISAKPGILRVFYGKPLCKVYSTSQCTACYPCSTRQACSLDLNRRKRRVPGPRTHAVAEEPFFPLAAQLVTTALSGNSALHDRLGHKTDTSLWTTHRSR